MYIRFIKKLFILLCLIPLIGKVETVYANTTLDLPSDLVYSTQVNLANVPHQISFTEPLGSIINPTDYLIISMPSYTSIDTSNVSISGSFVYGDTSGIHVSLSGHTIIITNISVVQGNTIYINGITAQNPISSNAFDEVITIATAPNGTNIKNQSTITPQIYNGPSKGVVAQATITPYAAEVNLSGYAYPQSFISVTENGNTIGTTTSDGTGYYILLLTGLSPGIHNFSIYGIDPNNNTTAASSVSLYAPAYQITNYQNIILSPIIMLAPSQINQGDTLHITGETVPNSNVTISINSPLIQLAATSDSNGNFSYDFNQTTNMTPGQYTVTAIVQTAASYQSIASLAQNFTVLAASSGGGGTKPSCDISKGDLNCDGQVDIYDFSILLYNWGTNNPLADVNGDGVVDLYDFSILMYNYSAG